MFFWDYGNAFLLEARRAGADVSPKDSQQEEATSFRYPSYVQVWLFAFVSLVAPLTRISYLCRTSWGKGFKIVVNSVDGDDFSFLLLGTFSP